MTSAYIESQETGQDYQRTGENNVNVLKLDGTLLDFWVAKSENLELLDVAADERERLHHGSGYWHPSYYHPPSD